MRDGRIVVCGMLLLLALAGPSLADGTRTIEHRYVVGMSSYVVCTPEAAPSIGGACFNVTNQDENVTLRIDDDVLVDPCGSYQFFDDNNQVVGEGQFVSNTTTTIPDGAVEVGVLPGTHINDSGLWGIPSCMDGKATTGTINATFT